MKIYYTLLMFDSGKWVPEYGSYDKQDCDDEKDYYREQGLLAKELKIIKTSDQQDDINKAIAKINVKEAVR